MRNIDKISIHCSDTKSGSVESFRRYHVDHNGWADIGYHYVINNGMSTGSVDGGLEIGRPIRKAPAAVKYHNKGMIGICLVGYGMNSFTENQFKTLKILLSALKREYGINNSAILGHRDYSTKKHPIHKECPCFSVQDFLYENDIRKFIKESKG